MCFKGELQVAKTVAEENTSAGIGLHPDDGSHKQVKVSVPQDLASAFKAACAVADASMASVLSQFMADYSGAPQIKRIKTDDYSTKRRRRAAIYKSNAQLWKIRDSEEAYQGRIPMSTG
jgi:hypothetical protein